MYVSIKIYERKTRTKMTWLRHLYFSFFSVSTN